MSCLKIPEAEARRVAAVRAALYRDRRWERASLPENFTPEGLRRRGQNPVKSGVDSLAFKLAVRYCDAVEAALNEK